LTRSKPARPRQDANQKRKPTVFCNSRDWRLFGVVTAAENDRAGAVRPDTKELASGADGFGAGPGQIAGPSGQKQKAKDGSEKGGTLNAQPFRGCPVSRRLLRAGSTTD